jgi:hypothetical protein
LHGIGGDERNKSGFDLREILRCPASLGKLCRMKDRRCLLYKRGIAFLDTTLIELKQRPLGASGSQKSFDDPLELRYNTNYVKF